MNRMNFTGLEDVRLEWKIEIDGKTIQEGTLEALEAGPGQTMPVKLNLSEPMVLPRQEVYLNLWYLLNTSCKWADAGHELGWDQFRIREFENNSDQGVFSFQDHHSPDVSISKTDIKIESDLGSLSFDANSGRLKHIRFGDRDLLASSPQLNVWRAPTDNDGIKPGATGRKGYAKLNFCNGSRRWIKAGLNQLRVTYERCRVSEGVIRMDDSTMNNLERRGLNALDQNLELALLHLEVEQHYSCGPVSDAFVHHTIWHVFPDLTLWMENKVMVHEDLNGPAANWNILPTSRRF